MIPLMYVLPTDAIYTPASGVVTKITPSYSHYRHSIQVEFKYNLDEFFYLEIGLSEFDQPSEVSLYGFYNSHILKVSDMHDEYHLIGKKVSVVLSKEVVLEIANNLVSPASFEEGSVIEFKIIQDKQSIEERAVISKIDILPVSLELTVNNQDIIYSIGDKSNSYQPTVEIDGNTSTPASVDGSYNIFDLPTPNDGLSLVITPPQDFENHYLFRQNDKLESLSLEDDGSVSLSGTRYFYNNGLMEYFGMSISMQKFLTYGKNEDYKTYIFNAARYKNLYSEISLLFPAVQHNSMTVYDLEENILIKGKVGYFSVIDGETDKLLHCISMTNCKDFFGVSVNKIFEFRYLPENVLTENISGIRNAAEIGNTYVIDTINGDTDVVPVDSRHIEFQQEGYLTSSNKKYAISIKKSSMLRHSQQMRGGFKNFKKITEGDFLSPLYKFDTIDFSDNTITVTNGTKSITKTLDEKNAILISKSDSRIDAQDHMTDFAGVEFSISPDSISTSGINITNFNDYLMLCRMVEEPTYGIRGVRRDTKDLLYSITFYFLRADITVIYNIQANKLYYINFAKKETVTSPVNLPYVFSQYISSIDEEKLKSFLITGGTSLFSANKTANSSYVSMDNDNILSEEVTHESYIDDTKNIASMVSSSHGITSFEALSDSSYENGTYLPRPGEISVMKTNFTRNASIFRRAMTGVYSNKPIEIISASVTSTMFNMEFIYEDETKVASISLDGGPIEIRKGLKTNIFSGEEKYSYMSAYTYTSSMSYEDIRQHHGVVVVTSGLGVSLGFDINIIEHMASEEILGINGTLSISYGNRMFMISGSLSDNLSIANGIITCGDVTLDSSFTTGQARALSFNGEDGDIVTTISNDEYDKLLTDWPDQEPADNGFMEIEEFETTDTYSIAFDITKTQYLQFKE